MISIQNRISWLIKRQFEYKSLLVFLGKAYFVWEALFYYALFFSVNCSLKLFLFVVTTFSNLKGYNVVKFSLKVVNCF